VLVYKITNILNGKSYIGQTIKSLKTRWSNHCKDSSHCAVLLSAIRKYGKGNFSISVIGEYTNIEDLNSAEEYFIELYQTLAPNGYNIRPGGNYSSQSEETKKKMSEAASGDKNFWFGKSLSKEHKLKISQALKGRKNPNNGNNGGSKRVVCNETGKIFVSISDASRNTGVDRARIRRQLDKKTKSYRCPFTFQYVNKAEHVTN